jgi:hypothetical protein
MELTRAAKQTVESRWRTPIRRAGWTRPCRGPVGPVRMKSLQYAQIKKNRFSVLDMILRKAIA